MNWGGTSWAFRTHAGINPVCLCCCAPPPEIEAPEPEPERRGRANWDNPFLGLNSHPTDNPTNTNQSLTDGNGMELAPNSIPNVVQPDDLTAFNAVNNPEGIEKRSNFGHTSASDTASIPLSPGIEKGTGLEAMSLLPVSESSAIHSEPDTPALSEGGPGVQPTDEEMAEFLVILSLLDDTC